jgi:DHA1 family bicyclomycin/chloramphenicol resistance-like MFS transporter
MGLAATGNVIFHLTSAGGFPWSLLPIPLYSCGMSIAMPSLTLLALDRFPLRRGLASSCQSFIQTTALGVAAALLAPLLWPSLGRLALGMIGLLAAGAGATWIYRQRSLSVPPVDA